MNVYQSDRLEDLADRMLENWAEATSADPLARTCIVVGNRIRGNWIKHRFLTEAARPGRTVLSNLDVRELDAFVQDWLFAALDDDPNRRHRTASAHGFTKFALTWRVEYLLKEHLDNVPELAPLRPYVADGNGLSNDERRVVLAEMIAELFADYQLYRPLDILEKWRAGHWIDDKPHTSEGEEWQRWLWGRLCEQNARHQSSFDAYFNRMGGDLDADNLGNAFTNGIPRYRRIYVFGVPRMSPQYLNFFRWISSDPDNGPEVSVYACNPCRENWLDGDADQIGAHDCPPVIQAFLDILSPDCPSAEELARRDGIRANITQEALDAFRRNFDFSQRRTACDWKRDLHLMDLPGTFFDPMGDHAQEIARVSKLVRDPSLFSAGGRPRTHEAMLRSLRERIAPAAPAAAGPQAAPAPLCSHPLLGSLGAGFQGLLLQFRDAADDGDIAMEFAPEPEEVRDSLLHRLQHNVRHNVSDPPAGPADGSLAVHVVHSRMREMEVLRDSLCRWFHDHADARPRDVLVLCPDLPSYAPFIDAMFGENGATPIPYKILGNFVGAAGSLAASFLKLLDLSRSRFEAPDVLSLLSVRAIRAKFGLDSDDIQTARDLVSQAAIRWGYDDAHVEEFRAPGTRPYVHTWKRGLDRLLLDEVFGDLPKNRIRRGAEWIEPPNLGRIRPTGHVDISRGRVVHALACFMDKLNTLRTELQQSRNATDWSEFLKDGVLGGFFAESEETKEDLVFVRRMIDTLVQKILQGTSELHQVDVFAMKTALTELLGTRERQENLGADRIVFAPLASQVPFPRRLVWCCGLNDGDYPQADRFSEFDLKQLHPGLDDPSRRQGDTMAFLEAILCARETAVFSYIGKDASSNESIHPAVPLETLLKYIGSETAHSVTTEHALHLPRHAVPQRDGDNPGMAGLARPADLPEGSLWEIALDDLVELFQNPPRAVLKSQLGIFADYRPKLQRQETMSAKIPSRDYVHMAEVHTVNDAFTGVATTLSEKGQFPQGSADQDVQVFYAQEKLDAVCRRYLVTKEQYEQGIPAVPDRHAFPAWRQQENTARRPVHIEFPDQGIRLTGLIPHCMLGDRCYVVHAAKTFYDGDCAKAWLYHLAACAAGLNPTTVLLPVEGKSKLFTAVLPDVANDRLRQIMTITLRSYDTLLPFESGCARVMVDKRDQGITLTDDVMEGIWHDQVDPVRGEPSENSRRKIRLRSFYRIFYPDRPCVCDNRAVTVAQTIMSGYTEVDTQSMDRANAAPGNRRGRR